MPTAATRPVPDRRPLRWRLGALALLVGLVAADWHAFRWWGGDYGAFWLRSGPVIGLATAALGWAWGGLDRHAGLISADPLAYAGSAAQAAGLPFVVMGGHLRRDFGRSSPKLVDLLLALPLTLLFAVGVLAWLVLIAPMQYFAFLVFGAPARIILASRYRVHAHLRGSRIETAEFCLTGPPGTGEPAPPQGWWNASMTDRPVAMTAAFMSAGLLVLNLLAPG
jgi:hypothetical protein